MIKPPHLPRAWSEGNKRDAHYQNSYKIIKLHWQLRCSEHRTRSPEQNVSDIPREAHGHIWPKSVKQWSCGNGLWSSIRGKDTTANSASSLHFGIFGDISADFLGLNLLEICSDLQLQLWMPGRSQWSADQLGYN